MLIIARPPLGYSVFGAITAIILGMIMVMYPGGVMALMNAAFWILQIIISIFILSFTISTGLQYFTLNSKVVGITYIIIGLLATVLVWLFNVEVIVTIIALFFIVSGVSEIISGLRYLAGRYFLIFLGAISVIVGIFLIRQPTLVAWIIAWYVLFWGVSRLFLVIEMKKRFTR